MRLPYHSSFRHTWWWLCAWLAAAGCHGGSALRGDTAPSIPEQLPPSLLWKLEGPGLKKPSYIFGTIHLIPEADFVMPPTVKPALHRTRRLVLELDLAEQLQMAAQMFRLAPMRGGTRLRDLLSADEYELVRRYFSEQTRSMEVKMMGFETIENWKPMLLQSFLYTDMMPGPAKSYEIELMQMASEKSLGSGGLETLEFQMSMFDSIPYATQARMLVQSVQSLTNPTDGHPSEMAQMVQVYRAQDLDAMAAFVGEESKEMKNFETLLLERRNRAWIPRIVAMAREQPTFFAVGAGHLGGPHGVLRLLLREGYRLTPVQ